MIIWKYAAILGALAMLGPFSTDTYFPFFPDMERHFDISPAILQQSLSVYLLTSSIMMLFHGALSDSYGRRKVILLSLLGFTIGSIGCAVAPSYWILLVFRAVQGLCAGAGMVVGQAVIRDQFDGIHAQKLISQVTMIFGLAPAIAPLVGGWLHVYFVWQSSFVLLALLGAGLWVACVKGLPESHVLQNRQPFHVAYLFSNYKEVATNLRFMALASCLGLGFGGFLIYVAAAPDYVLKVLSLNSLQFGWLFIPIVLGLILGSAIASIMAGKISHYKMIGLGYSIMISAALFNVLYTAVFIPVVPWAAVSIVLYTFGLALAMPSISILALDIFPEKRGMAASIQGMMQSLIFTLIAAFVAPLIFGSAFKYALGMLILLSLNLLCWMSYRKLSSRLSVNM
jgi:MFS transporter, DHA1 family, multidrug resistance protein